MTSKLLLVLGLVVLTAGCAPGGSSPAASKPASSAQAAAKPSGSALPVTKLNAVFTSLAGNQLPMWVAQDAGIFRQRSIEVSSSLLQGSPAMASLLSGEVQLVQGGGSELLVAQAEGSDLVALATLYPYFDFVLVVPDRIQSFS